MTHQLIQAFVCGGLNLPVVCCTDYSAAAGANGDVQEVGPELNSWLPRSHGRHTSSKALLTSARERVDSSRIEITFSVQRLRPSHTPLQ